MEFLIGIIGAEVLGSIVLSIVVGALAIMFVPKIVETVIIVTACIIFGIIFITSLVAIVRGGKPAKAAGAVGLLFCAGIVVAGLFGEDIEVAMTKSFLSVENQCAGEKIIEVGVLYNGDENWTTVWWPGSDRSLDKIPLKKNGRPFSLRIDTENAEDGRHLPRQKHRVFFEWRFIYPEDDPSIRVTYDGARILIHGDAVVISDKPFFNNNTMIFVPVSYTKERYGWFCDYYKPSVKFTDYDVTPFYRDSVPPDTHIWETNLKEGTKIEMEYSDILNHGDRYRTVKKLFTSGATNYIEIRNGNIAVYKKPIPCKFDYCDYTE